jgi:hypothetical protein
MEITAAGIEAETVIPSFSPKYAFAAPKITAMIKPRITALSVASGMELDAGTYGLNVPVSALVGGGPVTLW